MKVYWVESHDHCEDWFIAAPDKKEATVIFASDMGYDQLKDKVIATHICDIPSHLEVNIPGFVDNFIITECGGEFIEFHDLDIMEYVHDETLRSVAGETRIVRFNNKVYMEGNALRVALQMEGKLNNS